jgi:hypothetical protein
MYEVSGKWHTFDDAATAAAEAALQVSVSRCKAAVKQE